MRLRKSMLGAFALTLAAGSLALAQQDDKMVTAELFASVPQSVGNITFTPDNRVIYSHHPFFSPEIRVAGAQSRPQELQAVPQRSLEHTTTRH